MATETKEKSELKVATANRGFVRQTARKMRRTVNLIRRFKAGQAVDSLQFMPYAAAEPVRKLIESAIANASTNHGFSNPQDLYISQICVDDGPVFKRWRAASRGRAASVLKRTSKLSVVLSELKPADYARYIAETSPRNKRNAKAKNTEVASAPVKKTKANAESSEAPKAAKKPRAKKSNKGEE